MKLKKVVKNIKKIPRNPQKYYRKALKEFYEEADDFFEDFVEDFRKTKKRRVKQLRRFKLYGVVVMVRPAYIFSERIESTLKIIVGASIIVSGIMATFLGFTKTSEIFAVLITSFVGRIILIVIGFSYFVVGIWKFFNLRR